MPSSPAKNELIERQSKIPQLKGKYYDLLKLYNLTNGQMEIIDEMIDVFLEQVKEYNTAIKKAIEEVDWLKIHKTTHKFKSSLKLIGIEQMIVHFETIILLAKEKNKIEDIKRLAGVIEEFCVKCVKELEGFRKTIRKNS